MVSYLGTFVQSRRLHSVLAFFVILVAVFFSFGGRGFAIEHSRGGAHARELSYATTAETLASGYIVSDLKIQRCIRGVACKAPREREHSYWEKVPIKLNPFPRDFQTFNDFMFVEKSKIHKSGRYVVDVSFTDTYLRPTPIVEGAGIDVQKLSADGFMWIQYITNDMPQVPMVRDINVLFNKKEMADPRKHWQMNAGKIPIAGDHEIDVRMSMLKASVPEEIQILQDEKEFEEVLKKNEILVSPHPKFKIMQIGDMWHTDHELRSIEEVHCAKDLDTLKFIEAAITAEEGVRLIIVTGVMILSDDDVHLESVILKALSPILDSGIPFVYASSNVISQNKSPVTRKNFDNFVASLPGCYNKKFEELDHRIRGVTNGNLKIYNVPKISEGDAHTDYNAIISKGADAFVTYLDSTEAMIDMSQRNFLDRINQGELAGTEQKLLFLDHPHVVDDDYPEEKSVPESAFKKQLEDFYENGYKAIAFSNPWYERRNLLTCAWRKTQNSKVFKCVPGSVGFQSCWERDFQRRVRLFEFNFEENTAVTWIRQSRVSSDAQVLWAGQMGKPNLKSAREEGKGEENGTDNGVVADSSAEEPKNPEDDRG